MLVTENVLVMDLNLPSWDVAPGWFVFCVSRLAAQRANNMSAQGNALGLRSRAMVEP